MAFIRCACRMTFMTNDPLRIECSRCLLKNAPSGSAAVCRICKDPNTAGRLFGGVCKKCFTSQSQMPSSNPKNQARAQCYSCGGITINGVCLHCTQVFCKRCGSSTINGICYSCSTSFNTQWQQGAKTMPPNTTHSQNCRIWWDPSVSAYRLMVPYRTDFPPLFKACIPFGDYSWDSQAKVWTFVEKYYSPVQDLVKKIFGSVTAISRVDWETANAPKAAPSSSTGVNSNASRSPNNGYIPPLNVSILGIDSVIIQFFKMVPYEAMKKAYLGAAMMYHPDRGGDAEAATNLNTLWQKIEKEVFKK